MWTNGGLKRIMDGTLNLSTATLKFMLLGIAYVPDPDHEFASSLTAHELNGTGYTGGFGGGGRKTLAAKVSLRTTRTTARPSTAPTPCGRADAGTVGTVAIITEITNDAASPVIALIPCLPPWRCAPAPSRSSWGPTCLKLRSVSV
jgi:hypothetical protein